MSAFYTLNSTRTVLLTVVTRVVQPVKSVCDMPCFTLLLMLVCTSNLRNLCSVMCVLFIVVSVDTFETAARCNVINKP